MTGLRSTYRSTDRSSQN